MRKLFLASIIGLLSVVASAQNWTGTNKTINSGDLRYGNGSELSINGTGNVQQPFYRSGSTWYKLTFSSFPLDFELASSGVGTNSWNRNGSIAQNPTMTNRVFDQSGFTITSGSTGYGTLKVKGNVQVGSDLFEVTFSYYVAAVNDNFCKVTTSIKNIGSATATNVRYWVGTRDDFVGLDDGNTKTKGNIVNGVFQTVPNATTQSRALQISNGSDAVLFYTTSPLGNMSHASCCQFTNSTGINPSSSPVSTFGDGSYAMFIRLPDLGVGQTQTFEWYYAAGTLAEISQVVSQVASASITVNNITTTTAQLNAFSTNAATGTYVVVPAGSTAPSAAEVLSGSNYGSTTVVSSGSGALAAGGNSGLNMTGLNPLTNYTVYFVSQYQSGGNTVTTSVTSQEFTTLFACGEIFSRVDGSAGSATCPAVSGTPYNASVNGTAYTTAPTTTKTSTIRYKWSAATAPSIVPVISSVWINGISSAMQIGPPSVTTITAGEYFVDYCLYNVNLPTTGSYSVRFINPQTGNEVGICSYTADNTGIPVVTPVLVPNTMPTITPPANNCTGTSSTLNFTVGDAETALNQLVVSATSSNTALLPNANITITQPNSSGSGSLAYNLVSGQTGITTITLTVLDHLGGTSTSTFVVGTPEIITISNSLCGANSLQWMTLNNVTSTTASGTGQNGITVAITHSVGGMVSNNGMYQPQDFPAQYNVPGLGTPVIQNNLAGDFQACFSQPVVNPVVAFSSIGNPTTAVTVTVSQPYTQVWSGTGTTWPSNTQFIGQEGDNIIRIDGTVTCVNFNYGTSETYATIAFGFENQNCYTPTICSGNSVTLTASGSTSYSWTPSSGLNTTTGAAVVATPSTTTTYTVSNPSNVCATPKSITVTVNTTPAITNTLSNQTVCSAASISAQTFTSGVTGTTYTWTNSNTAIGLAASGSGSVPAFTAQNNTSAPITATITVTPTSPALCVGATRTYTITVNPTPSVSAVANQNLCSGASTAAINFTGSLAGSTYSWTNNNTAIGLAASGTGNINSFTATNTTANPITSTITVTPSLNSCQGTARTFTLSANPIPIVTTTSSQSLCAGTATTAVNFSGSVTGTTYTWSNSNTAIGLAASGSGNIPSFTATNSTTSNLSGVVTVTPSANGCTGTTQSFTIAVRTVPTVVVPNDQVYIVGATVPAQTFTGSIPGTVYNWTNSNAAIGIPPIGNGDINSFTAANNTSSPISSTITVTPTNQFFYTVYRTHNGTGNTSQYPDYVMNASMFDDLFNVANSNTSVWSTGVTNPSVLLNWSGYTNLNAAGISTPGGDYFGVRIAGSFTAAESGVYTFELQGDDAVDLFLNGTAAVSHYGGHGMTSNTGTYTMVAGQTYSLVARHQEYGGGEGFILRWMRPSQSTFSIQPDELAGCDGTPQAFTITVDPIPTVNDPADVAFCEGTVAAVDFTGTTANTNYLWTNTNTSIGLAASGSNDLSFTTQNPTNIAQTATVTVTPQAYVTQGYVWGSVNENGSLTLTAPAGKVFTNVAFASYGTPSGSGGNYTLGACNATTSTSVISGLAIGNSTMTVVANNATFGDPCTTLGKALAVKLGYGVSITGASQNFTITVNPSATIANSTDTICTGTAFTFATASADIVPANTTYTWSVVNNSNINGATSQATSSATMSQTLYNASSVNQTQTYTVTPSSGVAGCVGAPFTYNVTVTPLPTTISTTGSTTFCDGGSVTLIAPVAPIGMSYTYQWNLNGTPIAGATSISYIANASGSYSITVTNNVGCSATSLGVVVTENPLPSVAAITGTTTVCIGSTTTLSSLTAGGTWSSSNTATAAVNAISGVVTGVSAGVATITYTVTNVNGCVNTQTAAVTVNALPTVSAITGAASICVGSATTFESATIGGVWSTSNAAVASVSTSGVVTGVSAGQATITYTVTSGPGCVSSVSADINVNTVPTPTITASGATTFCQGGSVTLTASSGSSYLWSNGAQTQAITVSATGSYYVAVTNAAGCSATSVAAAVTMNTLPLVAAITGATNVCVGSTTTFESATIGGVWSSSNAAVASVSASGVVTGVSAGQSTITYTVTSGAGCVSSVSADINVNAVPTPTITASGATTFCQGGSVTLTASAGSSYLWSNGAQTQSITVSTTGSYYVAVTNAAACSAASAATVVTVNALPTANILAGGPLTFCQGGSVTLNASPVVTGNTYLWSTGATTTSITATTSATITLTITSAAGCATTSLPIAVVVNANPTATITASGATTFCQGGSVTLTASAGSGNSYQWSNNTNDQILVVNTSGSYTVTVTNAAGCSTTSSATVVTVNTLPTTAAITGTAAVCIGGTTLLSTTATTPVWASANTAVATVAANGLVTGVSAGTTQVSYTITNPNGCTNTASVTVTVNQLPTAAIATVGATTFCQGGSVTLLASNAPAGMTYTYQWSLNGTAITGATANSYVANASGAYSVTITTNSGCAVTSAATNVTVNPLPILATNTGAVVVCENATTTIANAQVGGLWSTANNTVATINAVTGQVTGVNPGTTALTYTFTNANGCTNTSVTNFTVNALPSAIISASGATTFCQGGSVILTASTGTSYLWSTGATTASITVNNTQDVSVTVTNANGCSATSAITSVVVNALPVANITSLNGNVFCQGGSVTLVASNGSAYAWSNGAFTQSTAVASTQTLTVTVTNADGCSSTSAPFTVTMNAAPTTTITANGPTTFCAGGSVTLTAPTAAAYLWSSGETTQSIVASVDGPYTVTVTDGNGCIATSANTNITVLAVPVVQAIAGANNVCVGSTVSLSNATIGGVWSTNIATVATVAANGTVTGVAAGLATLTYTVTNANGCSSAVSFNMTVNDNPTLTAIAGTTAVCLGATTTLANAQVGGTWSSSDVAVATIAANGVVNGLTAGNATITYTYTNASGCTSSVSASLVVNALPIASVALSGPTTFCAGGSVTLTAPAGMTYAWSTGGASQAITVTTSGNYAVTITNANGCTATSAPVSVTVNALPTVAIAPIGATTFCDGGSVTLISPLNSTYSYAWNVGTASIVGASNNTLVASATGTYSLTVTDANGCSATSAAIPVTVNTIPVVTATAIGATTFCDGGSVILTASGAATYNWSNGSTSPSITVSTSGAYSVVGTSTEGCLSISNAITVVVNSLPTASISSTGSAVCLGSTVTLTATGGATYSWSNGSTNAIINVTAANTYTATVTSAEGCTSTASETVVFNANPAVVISANGPTVFCAGGSLTLTATGGSNYVWSNGDQGASTTVNQSGNYYVIVTNTAGCTTQSSVVTVTVNNNPVVASITGANAVCEGGNILLSSATIGGIWSIANNFIANIDGAGNVTGLNAGTTTVSYTVSTNGCTATATAQLNVLNNPVTPIITASGTTTLCPGGTVVLFASNGANYQWSSGATTPFIVANQSGAYTVSVIALNGCSATSLPVQVFIGDDTAPTITAPLNVTTTPNLGCEAIGVALGSPITSDNCGVATVTNDAPSIFPIGPTVVTWTVTDNSGNTSVATQVVTVVDNNAPIVQAPANVTVASNVYCEAIGVNLGNPIATDNCTENLTITNNAPSVYPIGTTTVTWTVVDGAGNVTTVDQVVTVTDESAPQVLLANTSVILDANGTASLGFEDLDNGTVDNCGIANVILSQSAFDCSHVGENLITVYVTDNSGNQSSASVLVTVVASDACGGSDWSGPTVPDAFTPNGNNYNDTWVIPGLEGYTTKKMEIYSRYGTLVYGADNYNNDWDGTLLNTGTPVPDGTYYYILILNGGKQLNGYVYINRVQK